jgi:hypothetical protein
VRSGLNETAFQTTTWPEFSEGVAMRFSEIAAIQEYLRKTFDNNRISVPTPLKTDAPVEVYIGDEFIGVLHRDEDEGEISYSFIITILSMDLPSLGSV